MRHAETGRLERSGLTVNHFWLFAAVARHLSLTKASGELRISQPAISYQLKQLEDLYGDKLYCEGGRRSKTPDLK
jgi:DNA-binding transcriptional LysR family regulator